MIKYTNFGRDGESAGRFVRPIELNVNRFHSDSSRPCVAGRTRIDPRGPLRSRALEHRARAASLPRSRWTLPSLTHIRRHEEQRRADGERGNVEWRRKMHVDGVNSDTEIESFPRSVSLASNRAAVPQQGIPHCKTFADKIRKQTMTSSRSSPIL